MKVVWWGKMTVQCLWEEVGVCLPDSNVCKSNQDELLRRIPEADGRSRQCADRE